MLCPTCNAEIPVDSAFCPKCGQRVAAAAKGAAPVPVSAPTAADRLRAAQATTAGHAEPEHDLWRGGYTAKAMYGNWILAGILTIAAIALAVLVPNPAAWIAAMVVIPLIWIGLLLLLLSRRMGIDYRLTSQRFLHKRGVLSRESNQILLVDIDDVSFKQSFIGRLLNFGTITLLSNDLSDAKLKLVPVDDVERVTNLIDEARREERRKRAIYMASA